MEDYLEAIYHIVAKKGASRVKDIAVRLGVNSPSVTGALRLLTEKGYINYAPYDVVTLTASGEKLAEDIVRRHEILKDFFIDVLDVDETDAEESACKMEHAVSPGIIDRMVRFVEFIKVCPRGGEEWIDGFKNFCKQDGAISGCEISIERCLENLKKRQARFKASKDRIVTLNSLEKGQTGRLIEIKGQGTVSKKFKDLDITPGSIIEFEDSAEAGEAVSIKVRGYHFTLRREDAEKIDVEII